jgi:superfamily II DNA/RNA helicase
LTSPASEGAAEDPAPRPAEPAPDFAALGVAPALAQRAADLGWHRPTAVQTAAWPAIVRGRDVLAQAPTGSGKTAAWLLPLVQRLMAEPGRTHERPRRLQALVLAPTRELALQIGRDARALAPHHRIAVLVGGVSANPQMMALRGGAHVAVATPGRLLDLAERNALRLSDVELLVLDEADRLLDLGFADELTRLLARLPRQRQTLLFSATLPEAVTTLAAQALHDPQRIDIAAAEAAAPAIVERALVVDTARRTALLRHLITTEGWPRSLVFVASQHTAEHVADKLRQGGIAAAALHGGLSAGRRQQVLADFKLAHVNVVVATDLAARGLHIEHLGAVLQYDLPRSVADHTHRIGRTGRLGQSGTAGVAISFICADAPGSEAHFRRAEKQRGQRVTREQLPGFEPTAVLPPMPVDTTGGIKGRRKSKKDKAREAAALGRQTR